jgi:hypothetical protein
MKTTVSSEADEINSMPDGRSGPTGWPDGVARRGGPTEWPDRVARRGGPTEWPDGVARRGGPTEWQTGTRAGAQRRVDGRPTESGRAPDGGRMGARRRAHGCPTEGAWVPDGGCPMEGGSRGVAQRRVSGVARRGTI